MAQFPDRPGTLQLPEIPTLHRSYYLGGVPDSLTSTGKGFCYPEFQDYKRSPA